MNLLLLLIAIFFCSIQSGIAQVPDSLKDLSIAQLEETHHLLKEKEQYDKMIPYALAAVAKAEQLYGKEDTLYARMLYTLGFAYSHDNKVEKGMELYNQAATIQKVSIPQSLNYANTLEAIANSYHYDLSKYDLALPLYIESKNIREKTLGKDHPDYATSLYRLAGLYENMGNYDLALSLYIESKNIREKTLGKDHPNYANSLNNLAYLYMFMGNYDLALSLFVESKNIREKTLGKDHPDYATSLYNLAGLHERMGDYEMALPLYIETKNIDEKTLGKDHPDFASTLNNLAGLHEKMGDYDLALPLYIQSKNIYEKMLSKNHPNFATSLSNLAGLYVRMENYDLALPLFIEGKNIREKTLGKDHPNYALSLNNLAQMPVRIGNYDLALPLFIESKNIRERVLGKDHPHYALSLSNLAVLHTSKGDYDLALPLYTQCKNIQEKAFGENHPEYAISLNDLAALHVQMGNYDLALPLYIQSKNIYEKTLDKGHPYFATSLNNLAQLYSKKGDYDLALPLYIESKNIREKALGKDHPDYATSLNSLAALHQRMGDYSEAWKFLEQAMNIYSETKIRHNFNQVWYDSLKEASYPSTLHLNKMVGALGVAYSLLKEDSSQQNSLAKQLIVLDLANTLLGRVRNQVANEKDKLRILSQSNDLLINSLELMDKEQHIDKAFLRADENKSVLLLQATKSEAVYRLGGLPDSLIWKDKKLLKKQSKLQAKLLEKRKKTEKDSLLNELNQINQDINSFIKAIKDQYPKYHKLKYEQVDAKVEEIQGLLDKHTALLEYVISDSVVHIFCVDKQEIRWKRTFVSNKKLTRRIKKLHSALSNYTLIKNDEYLSYQTYTEQAHWFYQELVAPVLADKSTIKNLIIVTDGELGHLPFETFLMEPAPDALTDYGQLNYLVSDYQISYNYSATLWKENVEAPKPKNNGQILGFAANYNIKLDTAMVDVRLPTDQWLRGVLKPLPAARKEVELLQEKYRGFFAFDQLASEKTVKEKASDFAILHFATHGILDSERPMLSSLAFSEDNDSIESNFWQAHEISKMELNADLVVLSACETGYGEFEKGNGIASLARAFMYAGSPALIVSLWQVNDLATSKIMENLYNNFADGMDKDEALRQAKLQYIKSAEGIAAHPAFWSPFIQMGNTEPVSIQRKGVSLPWMIWGGTIVFLLLGGFVWSSRRRKKEVA
ncbi:MAG: CHAT domain-containing protein [Aureispira sp.]|nr:CHAT domain-containing protein [Aureispira sp.]